ncbi:hypothetical protein CRI85_02455 [Leuconostoc pseudomesenteroides]|uniref:DUF2188 domain-containing protein n=1 Tax=Leuconostoc pseudomesenteroides TaxID=33968 RepID=UPI001E36C41C|nr:DUF2188 domain-containing protein [Leuconostoc pseudomesenteroides]MCC8439210.1 hypothetical protein [Leuconostoc pseudomesenteroides]
MGKNQHVVSDGKGGWNVKGEGNSRATANFAKQSDAVERAKDIARNQNSEELTHGRNGQIRDRSSYGHDPHPPKG